MTKFTIRLDEQETEELEALSKILKVSKNTVVATLIRQEYNKFESDPKIKQTLELLEDMKKAFSDMAVRANNLK